MAYRESAPKNDLIQDAEKWKEREKEKMRLKKETIFDFLKAVSFLTVTIGTLIMLISGLLNSYDKTTQEIEKENNVCKDEAVTIGGSTGLPGHICKYIDARGHLEGQNFICTCIREGGTD